MPTPILPCPPDRVWQLLPEALAGRQVLLPTPNPALVEHLRPDLPIDHPGAAMIVTTSGSTGRPKGVVLSASALLASARATRQHLGGPMRWYSPLPRHYIAGVMVLVRAHESGTDPVALATDLHDLPGPDLDEPRALSIVPTHLHRALDDPDLVERLAGFDVVLLGGAAARADLLARARDAGVRVVTTYGMSETCGGCVYDGVPLPGVEVSVAESSGRISLGGPMVFSGYRLDPALSAQTLVGNRVLTRDLGTWAEGRLQVLGRVDDVVISGGVNVDLALVQRHLDGLGGAEAVVVAVPDSEWGSRLVLVTAPADSSGSPTLTQWRDRLAATGLARAALPRQLIVLGHIPRTSSGKIDRQALTALAQDPWARPRHMKGDD